jgi:hypothetical protein
MTEPFVHDEKTVAYISVRFCSALARLELNNVPCIIRYNKNWYVSIVGCQSNYLSNVEEMMFFVIGIAEKLPEPK